MVDRNQTADSLIKIINKMMEELPSSSSNNSIFERPRDLPQVTNQVVHHHEPKLVALGFSHPRPNADMTKNKVAYTKQLFQRGSKKNKDYIQEFAPKIIELREKIFSCYDSGTVQEVCNKDCNENYSPRSPLVKIIFDTCFVLELIYKWLDRNLIEADDPIFRRGENLQSIVRDMFVLSNQIPFFLLKEFYQLTAAEHGSFSFIDQVVCFIEKELCINPIHVDRNSMKDAKHLLAFAYDIWVNSSELGRATSVPVGKKTGRQRVIRNATELRRAGVRFRGVNKPTFDLKFRPGVLEIPVLNITTETECFLQNVIAYEQLSHRDKGLVVSDYCVFMDCLIQSPQDVQLLRENGVIESYLHDDKDVVSLFDKLGKRVPSSTHFCYSDLFDQLNMHCVRRWNSWKAKLRRDYFRDDNQLEAFSFMLALYIILPVTVLQTVYTVLSYYKGK